MDLKVMIVDDEKLERILIRKSFDWEARGFKVIAEADSGESAMQDVKAHMPDIILTDINMPFMDGISFAAWVKTYHPACKIIMITGYREFEYAQKAIKIGVEDFLLKPISKKDMMQVLMKLKEDIDEARSREIEIYKLKTAYDDSEPILIESFLQRLVAGRLKEEADLQKIKLYQLDYLLQGCLCVNIKIEDRQEETAENLNKLREDIRACILSSVRNTYRCTSFIHYMGNIIVLFSVEKNQAIQQGSGFYQFVLGLKRKIKESLAVSVTIGVGTIQKDADGIAKSYNQSLRALTGRIVYGKGSVITYETFDCLSRQSSLKVKLELKEFTFALENNLQDKVIEHIDTYAEALKMRGAVDLHQIHIHMANIIAVTLNVLAARGKNLADVFGDEQYIYDEAAKAETIDEMNQFLKGTSIQIMNYLNRIKAKRANKLIVEAQKMIEENLGDSTLTLKSLSAYLYVNDSYLSRTFKKELGESVIEYITRKRIEKSIEIFKQTDLKAYEVAERVGINDPHYFGVCFKKYTGKTIKEFKQLT